MYSALKSQMQVADHTTYAFCCAAASAPLRLCVRLSVFHPCKSVAKIINPYSSRFFPSRSVTASHAWSRPVTRFSEKKDCLFFYEPPQKPVHFPFCPVGGPGAAGWLSAMDRELRTLDRWSRCVIEGNMSILRNEPISRNYNNLFINEI